MGWICTQEEVEKFLENVHILLSGISPENNLYVLKENKAGDKTHEYMIRNNINRQIICTEILKLDTTNYSKTDYDDNPHFKNEKVWLFGQMYGTEELYIKLKLRGKVICLSFHEKQFDIKYPYL